MRRALYIGLSCCALCLSTGGLAASYTITADQPGWTLTASIEPEPVLLDITPSGSAVVVMNDPFVVTVNAAYDAEVEGSVTTLDLGNDDPIISVVWSRVDSSTFAATVRPGMEQLVNGRSMDFRGHVQYQGSNGTSWAQFQCTMYPTKELNIGLSAPSRSMLDFVLSRPEGFSGSQWPQNTWVNGGTINVMDAGPFTISPERMTTGPKAYDLFVEDGTASAAITAPLASTVDEDGYINGEVTLSASDGARLSSQLFYMRLPFAMAEDISGYAILHSREGVLMNPRLLVEGEILRPGDVIEVVAGNGVDGDLIMRFCDGHQARIQSYWGTRIQLGQSQGVDAERSSVRFWLSNAAFDVTQNPREYGRIIIYKAISDGVGNAVVPGGGVARFIFRKAASEGVSYILQQGSGGSPGLQASRGLSPVASLGAESYSSASTYIAASIYSDGMMRIQSGDGTVQLSTESSGTSIPSGASVMVDVEAPLPTVSSLAANELGAVAAALQWSVSAGTVFASRTPYLEIRYPNGDGALRLNTLECRINGILAADALAVRQTAAELRIPPALALAAGTNHLEVAVTCVSGARSAAALAVIFDGSIPPPAPESLDAERSTNGVWLTWRPSGERDLIGYNVYGADAEGGPFTLLTSTPHPVEASIAPAAADQPAIALEPLADGIRITPTDASAHLRPYRAQRAISDLGPWTDVVSGQLFGPAGMLDTTAAVDQDYWYRPIALQADGTLSVGAAVGPVQRPSRLATLPSGLTAWRHDGQVEFRWDPSDAEELGGYHVYRSQGGSYVRLTAQPRVGTTFTDTVGGNGEHRWRVVPVSTNGVEGPAPAEIDLAWWEPSGAIGGFNLTRTQAGATEAKGFVEVDVDRINGSSEAAFVTFATTPDTANADEDYLPTGGTLVFEPGETRKTLRVDLVNDAIPEGTETFTFGLTSVSGGASLEWPYTAQISIFNGSVVPPPEVVGPTNFTVTAGESFFRWIQAINLPERFTADTPPVWLTVDASRGSLQGTPDTPGTFDVPITLFNFASSTTVTFRIQVVGVPLLNWQSHQVGAARWLGAHYADARYLLCGEGGAMAQSLDGQAWTPVVSGVSVGLNAVVHAANRWIAVGDTGTILTSPDAAAWTPRATGLALAYPLTGVAGGNGQFVVVGYERTIFSSVDAVTWTIRKIGGFNPLAGVAFGNSRFVATGGLAWGYPTSYVSSNAVDWTAVDASGGAGGSGFDDIAYGNGRFVVVGASGRIFSSTNTIDWTQETSGTIWNLLAVGFGDGMFVAVGDHGTILCSNDGQSWFASSWAGSQMLSAVTYGDGMFVIGGQDGLVLTATLRLDSDGDGMNDAAEAIAGTDPWDRKSLLRLEAPSANPANGQITVRWSSQAGRTYSVLVTDSLLTPFHVLQYPVAGQAGYTEVIDAPSPAADARFYLITVDP